MQTQTFRQENLAFYSFCLITTLAMVERLSEVVCQHWLTRMDTGALTIVLMLVYGGYLFLLSRKLDLVDQWLAAHSDIAPRLFFVGWLCLGMLFSVLYQLADSGALGFVSDRDEALDVAVKQLWQGHYPYYCRVEAGVHDGCPAQGNLVGPMPGALIVASPVVFIFGRSAALSWLTFGLAFLFLSNYWRNSSRASSHLFRLLLAAPIILAEILSGGDLLANSILVSIPLLLLVDNAKRPWGRMLAVLLGVALSWRGLFWLLVFPVGAYLVRHQQWRRTFGLGMIVLAAFLCVTLPFALWDFANFAPWHIQQRFDRYAYILPHAGILVPLVLVLLGSYWGWRAPDPESLFRKCGWVLLLTVLAAALFNSLELLRPTLLFYGWYALAAVIFLSVPATGTTTAVR